MIIFLYLQVILGNITVEELPIKYRSDVELLLEGSAK